MSGFEWMGDKAIKIVDRVAREALMQVAQDLKAKSIDQAPLDTGDLRGSCKVTESQSETANEVKVAYGTEYAIRQHEETTYRHPKGGKAKYLEDPYKSNVARYEKHVKNAIENALK